MLSLAVPGADSASLFLERRTKLTAIDAGAGRSRPMRYLVAALAVVLKNAPSPGPPSPKTSWIGVSRTSVLFWVLRGSEFVVIRRSVDKNRQTGVPYYFVISCCLSGRIEEMHLLAARFVHHAGQHLEVESFLSAANVIVEHHRNHVTIECPEGIDQKADERRNKKRQSV
jgi:hypothetical protein